MHTGDAGAALDSVSSLGSPLIHTGLQGLKSHSVPKLRCCAVPRAPITLQPRSDMPLSLPQKMRPLQVTRVHVTFQCSMGPVFSN